MSGGQIAPSEALLLGRFGEAIRARRLALNLSQLDLAKRAGVHRTYISDIERGTRNITLIVLMRLAHGLEMQLGQLTKLIEKEVRLNGRTVSRGSERSG